MRWLWLLSFIVPVSGARACASFSDDDPAPLKPDAATGSDGTSPSDAAGADAAADAGRPSIHGFAQAKSGLLDGGALVTLNRPPGAEKGDLLVLITTEYAIDRLDLSDFAPAGSPTATIGICNNTNLFRLQYATRVDEGAPSYALKTRTETYGFGALLVALGGAGQPQDTQVANSETPDSGAARSVTVQTESALVLVAFGAIGAPPQGSTTTRVEQVAQVQTYGSAMLEVYAGRFPKGPTGPFGPFNSAAAPCSGTLSMVVPPTLP